MLVRFGLHFDASNPLPLKTASGEVTLGPAGFLSVLETQLGLPSQLEHPSEAAFSYLQCLREASTPSRFFHRSLEVDPVSVARTLLEWREQWYEAGWTGTFRGGAPTRLADMAAVENFARGRMPLGCGERLQRVGATLTRRTTQIECVELHTPFDEFTQTWQRVLAALPCEPALSVPSGASGPSGSDLARVQAKLVEVASGNVNKVFERESLNGDGSLVVVRAASRDISADAVAEFLLATGRSDRTLVVAERDGIILDNALERAGLPRCGFQYHTRYRAATQVLKLCLALIWAPVSPHRMLQFLLHPSGPLPRWVRSQLANAVAATPGIGGPMWSNALAGIEDTQKQNHEAEDAEIKRLREDIGYWLEGERFDPRLGAPLGALVTRTQRVSGWASGQANTVESVTEAVLFGAAQAQCEALLAGFARLRDSGVESLPRLELERLIDEVTTDAPDPSTYGEAGHVRATTAPAAVVGAWPSVVWWNMASPPAVVSFPWSNRELEELRDTGVRLPEIDELLRQRSRQWLKPMLNATERLVLVVHDEERGTHPVWTQIENLFEGFKTIEVDRALQSGEVTIAPLSVPTRVLPRRSLPTPRRWWVLPADCSIARRDIESYSSLSTLCDYPHKWVLQYAAKLRAGRAADLSDGSLLYGNLGHRLIEEFFRAYEEWHTMPDREVITWVRATFPVLVEREGAVLLEPGRGVDRQRIGTTMERALILLLAHLRSAGIKHAVPEASREVLFDERRLTGAIDLLVTDQKGQHLVIDVKWAGQNYRRTLLAKNRALQLATYSYLQKALDASDQWPPGAFFILATGNMIASDSSRFPDAIVSPPESGEDVADLWQRIGATYDWRWEQLEDCRIEVDTALTEPDEDVNPPDTGLAPITGGDPFDIFVHLTGWEPFQ